MAFKNGKTRYLTEGEAKEMRARPTWKRARKRYEREMVRLGLYG
jgi:hypothetical protein